MSGDQIIFLIILAIAIWAVFYVADDFREIFAEEESYGDSPFIHPEMRKGEAASERKLRKGPWGIADEGADRLCDRRTRHKGDI